MTPPTAVRAASACLLAVLAVTFLDTTIVAVVLGDVQHRLGAGVIPLQWVLDGYALPFAALVPVTGPLGDRWGRRRLMLAGLVVFGAGSLLCALAPGVGALIAGRVVMGVGAAASEPGTLSVLRQLHTAAADRARAIGRWAAVAGLSLALGPVVGGVLVALGGFRTLFWVNAAAAVLLTALVLRWVPESRDPTGDRLDLAGLVLGTAGITGIVTGVITGEQDGFGAGSVIGALVIGVVCLVAFVVVERRSVAPLLDLADLARPGVAVSLVVCFAVYVGVFALFFLTALYLDLAEAWSGPELAAAFAPMAVTIAAGAVLSSRWALRRGPRTPVAVGCLVSAVALLGARWAVAPHPAFVLVAAVLALAGAGFGAAVVPVTTVVMGRLPAHRSGAAASLTNTARQLGTVLGVAGLGAIVNAELRSQLSGDLAARGTSASVTTAIVRLLESGGRDAVGVDFAHPNPLVADLVDAAIGAYRGGVHLALLVAAALVAAAGAAYVLTRRASLDEPAQPSPVSGTSAGSAPPSTASTASA